MRPLLMEAVEGEGGIAVAGGESGMELWLSKGIVRVYVYAGYDVIRVPGVLFLTASFFVFFSCLVPFRMCLCCDQVNKKVMGSIEKSETEYKDLIHKKKVRIAAYAPQAKLLRDGHSVK